MDLNEIKQRMKSGELYQCNDDSLMEEQIKRLDLLFEYNSLKPSEQEKKQALLKEMFASFGEESYIETPFHANWAGKFVHIGRAVYANFNLTLVDDGEIFIGDNVMIAPNVTICTGTHPVDPTLREKVVQYNLPVHIKRNAWIGAGSVILPGVTVGENSVIGAGSVVTKDIPDNVVAVGNPCKVMREINDRDKLFYHRDRPIKDKFE
ncbi:MAG: sugar O-acetyltransferase [Clostridia bacterium]|nr:sugar O-acetyltransferase [Clostridia bacterium]